MLHLVFYLIEAIIFVVTFLLFGLCLNINNLIERLWHKYIDEYYKDKKVSYIGKKIVTTLRFFIDILVIFMTLFLWGSLDYLFYKEVSSHHIKMPWLSSTSYINVVYLYKHILAILISQYIFALPLIVIYIIRIFRDKQNYEQA